MENTYAEILKEYGPWIIGYFIAWQLWLQNKKNDERFYTEKVKDVEAKVKLDTTLGALIEVIKEKLK